MLNATNVTITCRHNNHCNWNSWRSTRNNRFVL